jgi:hypothetical protein
MSVFLAEASQTQKTPWLIHNGARRRRNTHRLAGRCGRIKFPVPMLCELPSVRCG